MVVGNDMAIFAYEEATALGDRMAIPVRHDYGDNRPIGFSGYRRDIEMASFGRAWRVLRRYRRYQQ